MGRTLDGTGRQRRKTFSAGHDSVGRGVSSSANRPARRSAANVSRGQRKIRAPRLSGFYVAGSGRLSSATRSRAVMAFERSRSARAGNAEARSPGNQITARRDDAGVSWTIVTTIIKTLRLLLLGLWL